MMAAVSVRPSACLPVACDQWSTYINSRTERPIPPTGIPKLAVTREPNLRSKGQALLGQGRQVGLMLLQANEQCTVTIHRSVALEFS